MKTRCVICGFESAPHGVHLHEVRAHQKPQRGLEGRNVPSSWGGIASAGAITVPVAEWIALWDYLDRVRIPSGQDRHYFSTGGGECGR